MARRMSPRYARLTNDVQCARQAGALAIAASYGYEDVSACEADFVATSLAAAYEFGKNAIR